MINYYCFLDLTTVMITEIIISLKRIDGTILAKALNDSKFLLVEDEPRWYLPVSDERTIGGLKLVNSNLIVKDTNKAAINSAIRRIKSIATPLA